MEGRVLGTVSVTVPGERGVEGTEQPAALFAVLATSSGCRASYEEVMHCLWPDEEVPPDRIRRSVAVLRERLGRERVPTSKARMCAISVPEGSVDYLRFLALWNRSRQQAGKECFKTQSRAIEECSWADPLRGLTGPGFELRRSRLRAEHQQVRLERLATGFALNEMVWVEQEADELLSHWPNEKIFRYKLEAYALTSSARECRELINEWVSQHGQPIDGGLRKTFERVKKNRRSRWGQPYRPDLPVPQQIPSSRNTMIGRSYLIEKLRGIILERRRKGCGALIELSGMPGVGKTELAIRLAARIASDFPDGSLYVDLQGFSDKRVEPVHPEHVLDRFLADLGISAESTDLEGKSAELRTALARRSVLLVLDNAADAAQVLPLLPGDGACAAIVTSRRELVEMHVRKEVYVEQVDPLCHSDAVAILNKKLSATHSHSIDHLVGEIAVLCGHLPLALVIVAELLRKRSSEGVHALVRQLREERTRLQTLRLPDHALSVRLALECSFRALSSKAGLLLWQSAIHPGPTISWSALTELGSAGADVERAIDELVDAHLMDLLDDRYRIHDLVRVYARHDIEDRVVGAGSGLMEETIDKMLEYQLRYVWACDRVLVPGRELPVGELANPEVLVPSGKQDAMERLDMEYPTTVAMMRMAADKQRHRHAWLLPMALVTYQWRRNLHAAAQRSLDTALTACQDIASPAEKAMTHRMMAGSLRGRKSYGLAEWHLARAVSLSEQEAGRVGQLSLAHSLHALATIRRLQGECDDAVECNERALALFRSLGERMGEAAALNGLGTLHHDRGQHDEALRKCAEALRIFGVTDDLNGTANALTTLGKIHLARAEHDAALGVYKPAIEIYRELGYWRNEAKVLRRYAEVLLNTGRMAEAVEALERALVLLERLGSEETSNVADLLAGLR
ncbi:AfsR/SARP family transcriptional regulator [Streptomyces chrestomyceticus]|uniref:AfsR/SARP family transcriptional regulator n=1 Tax=Streptomyces chrestomyceticus TaxID=68185 RepID=UPI0033EBFA98